MVPKGKLSKAYWPSESVNASFRVPTIPTRAPRIGSPVVSRTRPWSGAAAGGWTQPASKSVDTNARSGHGNCKRCSICGAQVPVDPGTCCLTKMRISCGRSCLCPHKLSIRSVLKGRCARAEPGTPPARRLHARVRHHPARSDGIGPVRGRSGRLAERSELEDRRPAPVSRARATAGQLGPHCQARVALGGRCRPP